METCIYHRPVEWLALDMANGDLVGRYSCASNDFSCELSDKTYLLKDDSITSPDDEFYIKMNRLFEACCISVLQDNSLDETTYACYLDRVLSITPHDYRIFYKELSGY